MDLIPAAQRRRLEALRRKGWEVSSPLHRLNGLHATMQKGCDLYTLAVAYRTKGGPNATLNALLKRAEALAAVKG